MGATRGRAVERLAPTATRAPVFCRLLKGGDGGREARGEKEKKKRRRAAKRLIKDVVQKSSLLLFAPVAAPVRPCARRGRSARVALRRRMGSRAPPRRLRGGERRGKNRPWLQGKLLSTEGSERRRRQRAQQSEKKSREPRSIFVALAPRRRLHCLYQGSNGKHGPAGAVTRRVEAMAELENGAAGEDEGGVGFGVEERVNQRQRGRGGRREKKNSTEKKPGFFSSSASSSLALSLSLFLSLFRLTQR